MSIDLRGRPVWVAAFERTHNDDGEPVNGEHPLVFVPRCQGTGPTVHIRRENIMPRPDSPPDDPAYDDGPGIDTIETVRTSLAMLRTTWRHRSPESIDRDLARIDERLGWLAVAHEECDQQRVDLHERNVELGAYAEPGDFDD